MTDFAASRFPALAAPEPGAHEPAPLRGHGLGLTLALLPLPVGEFSVLLTAWLLIL